MDWNRDKVDILYDYAVEKYPFDRTIKSRTDDLTHKYYLEDADKEEIKIHMQNVGIDTSGPLGGKGCGCLSKLKGKYTKDEIIDSIENYFASYTRDGIKTFIIDDLNGFHKSGGERYNGEKSHRAGDNGRSLNKQSQNQNKTNRKRKNPYGNPRDARNFHNGGLGSDDLDIEIATDPSMARTVSILPTVLFIILRFAYNKLNWLIFALLAVICAGIIMYSVILALKSFKYTKKKVNAILNTVISLICLYPVIIALQEGAGGIILETPYIPLFMYITMGIITISVIKMNKSDFVLPVRIAFLGCFWYVLYYFTQGTIINW